MEDWIEVEKYIYPESPCKVCEMGYASIESKEEDGKLYIKRRSCHEKCGKLAEWVQRHLLSKRGNDDQ